MSRTVSGNEIKNHNSNNAMIFAATTGAVRRLH
jgi:hypothetical protein